MYVLARCVALAWLMQPLLLLAANVTTDVTPNVTADAAAGVTTLNLPSAERLALQHDVSVRQMQAQSAAQREQSVAAGQLPDPKLTLGAMNLPTDSFDRGQEPMTQLTVGVSQAFPPGASLNYQAQRESQMAEALTAEAVERQRRVLREVRLAYLELRYQQGALAVIAQSRLLFADLVKITKSLYGVGRSKLQDVMRAELELSLLDDREQRIEIERAMALAGLERWVGALNPEVQLASDISLLQPAVLAQQQAALQNHPALNAANQRVAAGQTAIQLSREQYKPGWMLGLNYGERSGNNPNGSERADFVSAMVTVDLPLFPGKRQDRRLTASVHAAQALKLARDDMYLELKRQWEAEYSRWTRLADRVAGFETRILPEARNNAEASLSAYRNGLSDFTTLMRAYLTDLENNLQALRAGTDYQQSQARLLYLVGEDS